ncbi:PAS domain S-box protein [Candidatus Kaiserbacteria bacterium]|nr:PAS domain S-box protein [Candidatus Kaiserbacteria bacterium]
MSMKNSNSESGNSNTLQGAGFPVADQKVRQREIAQASKDIESLLAQGDPLIANPIIGVLSQTALIAVTDVYGDIIYANDFFINISGYTKDELVGHNHRILKSGEHDNAFYKKLWDTVSSGRVWRGDMRNRSKDGSSFWVDTIIAPVLKSDGSIAHYISVRFLINDKKIAEEELHKKTETLESSIAEMKENEVALENVKKATLNILEDLDEEKKAVERKVVERTLDIEREKEKLLQVTNNMKGGAILFDYEGNLAFVNNKLFKMLDIKQTDIEKDNIVDSVYSYFEQTEIKDYFKDFFSGKTFTVPEIDSNGRIYEMLFLCLDKAEEDGQNNGYFFLLYDITDAKLLERSKSKLVAVASHQLRTPLTAMRGNVEMLIDESYGPLNKEQHELLGDIDISTNRLISMVNDMLDITKIERGDLNMKLEQVKVKGIIDSIKSDFDDYAKRRGVSVISEVPEELSVFGDSSRIRQVFQNLIDNAIKYSTDPGELKITSNVKGNFAQFIFKDKGVGIPEMEQSRIFGRFYRASNTANYSSSGSGLGLYIVKSIISQLGGDVWFESKEGVGTTFYVTLPIKEIKVNDK